MGEFQLGRGGATSAILLDPLFEQVMVVGEGRPSPAALTVLNEEYWQAFAASLEVDPRHAAVLRDPRVMKALTRRVADHLKHFPGYAQVVACIRNSSRGPWKTGC
ncbi:MAG: hypothetical protein WA108_04595 [Thiobacillus sp.]